MSYCVHNFFALFHCGKKFENLVLNLDADPNHRQSLAH